MLSIIYCHMILQWFTKKLQYNISVIVIYFKDEKNMIVIFNKISQIEFFV